MEEFKGTKGKWHVDKTAIKCDNTVVCFTATLISKVDQTRLKGESWIDMYKRTEPDRIDCKIEEEYNAKLIAAAPTLLHRLNSLILSVKAHPDYIFGEDGDEWHDLISLSEEAINKALK